MLIHESGKANGDFGIYRTAVKSCGRGEDESYVVSRIEPNEAIPNKPAGRGRSSTGFFFSPISSKFHFQKLILQLLITGLKLLLGEIVIFFLVDIL